MHLLFCWALFSYAFGVPLTELATVNDKLKERYELPGESIPTLYDVRLFLDPSRVTNFYGNVSIRIIPVFETDTIVLHAMKLVIDDIQVYSDKDTETDLFDNFTLAGDDTHFLRIRLNKQISSMEPHTIHIDYVGQFSKSLLGLYISSYKSEQKTINLITSLLEATYARRVFPCYDEPALKAVFRTTIYAPPAYPTVRSNMPERDDEFKPNVPGYLKYEFQDSPVMSTYLQAYLVSDFDYIDNTNDPIYRLPFKVFSKPGTQNTTEFGLQFGQKSMVALEGYLEFPYRFPKMDYAAVPTFAVIAIESPGLVIFKEVFLFFLHVRKKSKEMVGTTISHENSHQWFGNEVSPVSWSYLWLSEGFATFFQYYGLDMVISEWRALDQMVIALQTMMQTDAVLCAKPMTQHAYTPSQISDNFNEISFSKSGMVVRMMHHFFTPEVFRRGLVIYVRENSGGAAGPADLYGALQQALDESDHTIPHTVSEIMDRWTNQGGFPVLTVKRSRSNNKCVFVSQERFLTDSALSSTDRWHVPINWVLSSSVDFSDTSPQAWIPPSFSAMSISIPGLSQAEWFIINKQQTGYYRVNYDTNNWQALATVLTASHEVIHLVNRAQIIDDSFNMARNGRLNYVYALEISKYLVQEGDYIPWASASNVFQYLNVVLRSSQVYDLYQKYLLKLSAPLYSHLGFEALPNEEHVTTYHRNIILEINCQNGNLNCVNNAHELLQQYRKNSAHGFSPDIQAIVFCSSLRGGDADNFFFLWDLYVASTDPSHKRMLVQSLGCSSNKTLREFCLNQVIDPESPLNKDDKLLLFTAIITSSPEGTDAALEFVIEHFAAIQLNFPVLVRSYMLRFFVMHLHSQQHNTRVDELYHRHEKHFTDTDLQVIASIRENIEASIIWTKSNLATVESWLRDNFGSSATKLSSGIVSLLSSFLGSIRN